MPLTEAQRHNLALGGAAAVLAAGGWLAYGALKPRVILTTAAGGPLAGTFGLHSAVLAPSADGHLPDLVLALRNLSDQPVRVQASLATTDGTIHFSADDRPGHGLPSGVTVSAGPHVPKEIVTATILTFGSLVLPWTALWERTTGGGPFTAIAKVTEVS